MSKVETRIGNVKCIGSLLLTVVLEGIFLCEATGLISHGVDATQMKTAYICKKRTANTADTTSVQVTVADSDMSLQHFSGITLNFLV